jgi:hypothetical protein
MPDVVRTGSAAFAARANVIALEKRSRRAAVALFGNERALQSIALQNRALTPSSGTRFPRRTYPHERIESAAKHRLELGFDAVLADLRERSARLRVAESHSA